MPNTGPDRDRASASSPRRAIRVVAGVLSNADGEVLLAQRLAPKAYAGQWEFPGGKCEAGEEDLAALTRELDEELGVAVRTGHPLIEIHHDYPEFSVTLHVWRVTAFDGAPRSLEGQPLCWVAPSRMATLPLLAADTPIVAALRLPVLYCFTPPQAGADEVLAALPALPAEALLRLRLPALDDAAYAVLAREVAARWPVQLLLLDRDPALSAELGCGWHANGAALQRADAAPDCGGWRIASVHDGNQIARARAAAFDAAVLSPVRATPGHAQARPLGWDGFATLARGANLPLYALGGTGPQDLDHARRCGAQGVAAIRSLWHSGAE